MFVEENPNERIRATARRHVLEGSHLDTASRVAREAIQNSVDATLPDQKTDVVVLNQTLSPDQTVAFRESLGLDADDSPVERLSRLGLPSPNALTRLRDGEPVAVTIVEDRNTCGLGYDVGDQKDRFEELCLSLGQDRTSVSTGRGGSYGLGKAVYEEASNSNMFVVYSIFEPSAGTGGHHARLFACATFDGHMWEDRKCTGRALFGVHEARESGQPECKPIVDDMAHEIAESIGIRRAPSELGTSIMIVGSSIKLDKFREAVERWWWPRLLSNKLTVDLRSDGDQLPEPDPWSDAKLEGYIRCYTMVEHGISPEGPLERRPKKLRRVNGLRPGTLALMGLEPHQSPSDDDSDDSLDNAIALIRGGPLMVVEYSKISGGGDKKCVGVFVGHDDADEALHLSEPPSHDAWNPNSQRLRDAYPDNPEKRDQYQELVQKVVHRVKTHAKKFLKELNPVPEPPARGGSRRLQQILARVMATKDLDRPSPSPPIGADPFKLEIRDGRETSGPESVATARVVITLRDDATAEAVGAVVAVKPSVVLDDNLRRDGSGRLALASMLVDGEDVDLAVNHDGARVVVHKNRKIVVEARSEPFSRDYFARVDIEVTAQPDSSPTEGLGDRSSPAHEGAVT